MNLTVLVRAAIVAALLLPDVATAALLKLTGRYNFAFSTTRAENANGYLSATGRKQLIRAPFYRAGAFAGGGLKNIDTTDSGTLSVEFHSMAFIGATSGGCLYTRSYEALPVGFRYDPISEPGAYFKSLNRAGYGTIVVYEYVFRPLEGVVGWVERTRLSLDYGSF